MSFGESVFSTGFTKKTGKGDLFVKANQVYPQRNRRGKTLEHSGRQLTEADHKWMTCGAGQPSGPTYQPPFVTSVLHCP
jgi:hypothetical protein